MFDVANNSRTLPSLPGPRQFWWGSAPHHHPSRTSQPRSVSCLHGKEFIVRHRRMLSAAWDLVRISNFSDGQDAPMLQALTDPRPGRLTVDLPSSHGRLFLLVQQPTQFLRGMAKAMNVNPRISFPRLSHRHSPWILQLPAVPALAITVFSNTAAA